MLLFFNPSEIGSNGDNDLADFKLMLPFNQLNVQISALRQGHYNDVIIKALVSQITRVSIVCSTVCSGANQRKHKSSVSLTFVRGPPVNGEFPSQKASGAENVSIDDVIMGAAQINRLLILKGVLQ